MNITGWWFNWKRFQSRSLSISWDLLHTLLFIGFSHLLACVGTQHKSEGSLFLKYSVMWQFYSLLSTWGVRLLSGAHLRVCSKYLIIEVYSLQEETYVICPLISERADHFWLNEPKAKAMLFQRMELKMMSQLVVHPSRSQFLVENKSHITLLRKTDYIADVFWGPSFAAWPPIVAFSSPNCNMQVHFREIWNEIIKVSLLFIAPKFSSSIWSILFR